MSVTLKPTTPAAPKILPAKSTINSDLEDPDNIDARLQHLNKNVLPKSPYLLTVPSDIPYRVHHQQANNWKINSPFDADEEGLQYMSFLYRDWDDSIIVARGNWDNEGSIMENGTGSRAEVRSGTSTPSHGQGQKKKITLSDYKSKPKAGLAGQGVQADGLKGVKSQLESNSNHVPKAAPQPPAPRGQKRPLDAPSEDRKSKPSASSPSAPPTKKIKTSPPRKSPLGRSTSQNETGHVKAEPAKPPLNTLPPLLSPTLPASIEEGLTKMPKSPLDLEGGSGHKKTASIASTASDNKPLPSSHTSSSSINSSSKTIAGGKSHRPSPQAVGKQPGKDPLTAKVSQMKANASAKTQPSEETAKKLPPTSVPKPSVTASEVGSKNGKPNGIVATSSFFQSLKTGRITSPALAPTSRSRTEATEPKKTLLVRLKYPKNHKKTLERILQMKPRPKKIDATNSNEKPKEAPPKIVDRGSLREKSTLEDPERLRGGEEKRRDEQRDGERHQPTAKDSDKIRAKEHPRQAEKRPRPADGDRSREPPAKRLKPHDNLDASSSSRTPVPSAFKSPALSSQGSAQKKQISPPKKDLKSVAMRRVDSGDGNVRTPQAALRHGTPTAPSSAEKPYREERGSCLSSSKGRLKDIEGWRAEQKKYTELGRKLKHEADYLLKPKSDGGQVGVALAKQGTALAIETVLCYMLAFNAGEQSRNLQRLPGDAQSWRSILLYLNFVTIKSESHPHLHGLCFQVGAVCREIIHTLDVERLKNDPLPVAAAEEVQPPTPGTDHNPPTGEIDGAGKAATYRKNYLAFQAELIENAHEAKRFWAEGTAELTVDDLQTSFPQTWAHRSKYPLPIAGDKRVPGQYQGAYYLPLGAFSSGLEAVRFAHRLLGEWTAKERVDWKGRLEL
ncbi:MAG: hypothetical protein M1812_001861 [Candelaria pacifica]|nr:MAG: hypothetical protein M1812_001861 [Candelaria pacifica]